MVNTVATSGLHFYCILFAIRLQLSNYLKGKMWVNAEHLRFRKTIHLLILRYSKYQGYMANNSEQEKRQYISYSLC